MTTNRDSTPAPKSRGTATCHATPLDKGDRRFRRNVKTAIPARLIVWRAPCMVARRSAGRTVMGHIVRIAVALLALAGCRGEHEGPGTSTPARPPAQDLAARAASQTAAREQLGSPAPAPSRSSSAISTCIPLSPPMRSSAASRCSRAKARIRPPTRGISPASAPRSTSGASTTTPRPSRRSTGARPRTPSGSATRSPETPATPTHLGLPLDERCAGPHLRTTLASARRLGCGLRSRQEAPAGTTCRTRCLSSSCRSR
jgi:hypothetical protein